MYLGVRGVYPDVWVHFHDVRLSEKDDDEHDLIRDLFHYMESLWCRVYVAGGIQEYRDEYPGFHREKFRRNRTMGILYEDYSFIDFYFRSVITKLQILEKSR